VSETGSAEQPMRSIEVFVVNEYRVKNPDGRSG